MRKIFYFVTLVVLLLVGNLSAQSTLTVTGVVFDPGGNLATSGFVEFDITPQNSGVQYYVAGVGTVSPQTVQCPISGVGTISCQLWGNDRLVPANTCYTVTIAPNGMAQNSTMQNITGTSYNINSPNFCPVVNITPQQQVYTGAPVQANITPIAPHTFSLGSPSLPFANLYVDALQDSSLSANIPRLNLNNLWTGNQTGPFYEKNGPIQDVAAYATVVCNNSVDDTAAVNAAMTAAGSLHSPPTFTYVGALHNLRQQVVRFPSGGRCKISSTIVVPPGVLVDLNNSTVTQTVNGQDAFDFAYDFLGGYGYGTFWGGLINGFLQGPGSSVSTGSGLFLNVASFGIFQNLQIQGFKFGVQGWEIQYTYFGHVYATNNKVGFYLTARPTATTLTSIDLTFEDIVADLNDVYGIWCQECSDMKFTRIDVSRNLIADIVLGSQLNGYLKTYTVNSGGSGYALNAKIAATITDATGHYAQAFATTNGAGVVTSVTMTDAGQGYTAPSVSIPGGGVAASVTANIFTDAGLGAWDGVASINRGSIQFDQVKAEHCIGTDGPFSGYSMLINDTTNGAFRGISIHNYRMSRQVNSSTPGCAVTPNSTGYARMIFNAGFGNTATFDDFAGYDAVSNPGQGAFTDVSMFRNIFSQGWTAHFPTFSSNSDDVAKYTVWSDSTLQYGGFTQAVDGFTGDGQRLALGFVSKSSFGGANALKSYVAGEANPRFQLDIDGTHHWGPGTGAFDTSFKRLSSNALQASGSIDGLGGYRVNNLQIIPSTTTGFHGTTGTKMQMSDGTGTSVPAVYDANGNLTAGSVTGTGAQVLASGPTITSPSLVTPTIGGAAINKLLLSFGTLTFTAIAAQTCQEQNLLNTGTTTSAMSTASPTTNLGNTNLSWSARPIADNIVVRVCNPTAGAITPTAVIWTGMSIQ